MYSSNSFCILLDALGVYKYPIRFGNEQAPTICLSNPYTFNKNIFELSQQQHKLIRTI